MSVPTFTTAFTVSRDGSNIIARSATGFFTFTSASFFIKAEDDGIFVTFGDTFSFITVDFTVSTFPTATTQTEYVKKLSAISRENTLPVTAYNNLLSAENTAVIQLEFPYLINPRLVDTTVTGTGSVTVDTSMCLIGTSSTTGSVALMESVRSIRFRAGEGVDAQFSALFTPGITTTEQYIGIIDDENGFAFGYDGISFGVLHRNGSVDNWIHQDSWSIDTADGNGLLPFIGTTFLNIYDINFQWGAGLINFMISNPLTGTLELVHRIQQGNQNTVPSLRNPTLELSARADNGSSTTDIVIKTANMTALTQGKVKVTGYTNTFSIVDQAISTPEEHVFTLRNALTFGGVNNKIELGLQTISVGTDTAAVIIHLTILQNATLVTPSFIDLETNASIMETDVAGGLPTGGRVIFETFANRSSSSTLDVRALQLIMEPGDTFSFVVHTVSGNTDFSLVADWVEDA